MANGQIISGAGTGRVKTYIRSPKGIIAVKVRAMDGVTFDVSLDSPDLGTNNPSYTGGGVWTVPVAAPKLGRYTLTVQIRVGNALKKELKQQIEVVQR